ncbi:MAG: HPr family phosphocarrier protein [Caldicoprobacterales bacterium]|nr:HPr family phosphocarrier protein [Clostridiales bacterium]
MLSKNFKIMHEDGLTARPAALFVQVSSKFNSRIWVEVDSKKVNAKSIMGIISLGIGQDDEITITAEGNDQAEAMDALTKLIDSNFTCVPVTDKD